MDLSIKQKKQQWAKEHGCKTFGDYQIERSKKCKASGKCTTPDWDCDTECNKWAIGNENGYNHWHE
jgi:hypothetical protein